MSVIEQFFKIVFESEGTIEFQKKEDDLAPLMFLSSEKYLEILKKWKEYQPLTGKHRLFKEIFKREPEELVTKRLVFPTYKHLLAQSTFFEVMKDWKIVKEVDFDLQGKGGPVTRMSFDVDYNRTEESIRSGTVVLEGPERDMLVAEFSLFDYSEVRSRSELNITCLKERGEWLEDLAEKIERWMDENNYLKGKKIKPDASFLGVNSYTWDDIILPDKVKEEVRVNLRNYFEQVDAYKKNKIPLKRGVLCWGPPGTGKTLLGKIIAAQIESTFIWVTASHMQSSNSVTEIFEMARELAPCIMFFEDLDFYASRREFNQSNAILGELLAQLDGFEESDGIFIIATTNDLKAIEPALKDRPSRFDCLIEFREFDRELRARMLKYLMKDYPTNEDPERLANEAAGLLKDMTGAELNEFFLSVLKTAIEKGHIGEDKKVVLTLEVFKETVEKIGVTKKRLTTGFSQDT